MDSDALFARQIGGALGDHAHLLRWELWDSTIIYLSIVKCKALLRSTFHEHFVATQQVV
jgi:hypothetical protein